MRDQLFYCSPGCDVPNWTGCVQAWRHQDVQILGVPIERCQWRIQFRLLGLNFFARAKKKYTLCKVDVSSADWLSTTFQIFRQSPEVTRMSCWVSSYGKLKKFHLQCLGSTWSWMAEICGQIRTFSGKFPGPRLAVWLWPDFIGNSKLEIRNTLLSSSSKSFFIWETK
jgi:hypothetical protein